MASATDSTRTPEPSRRSVLGGLIGAPLTGVVIGHAVYRSAGPDMTAVAEGWINDARELGMILIVGADGNIWKTMPIGDGEERADARDRLLIRLDGRPRLMRAVHAAVKRGFVA